MTCQMCGSAKVKLTFHQGATYWGDVLHCGYGESSSGWASKRRDEHLHYRCEKCRYDWTADTLAEQSQGKP